MKKILLVFLNFAVLGVVLVAVFFAVSGRYEDPCISKFMDLVPEKIKSWKQLFQPKKQFRKNLREFFFRIFSPRQNYYFFFRKEII